MILCKFSCIVLCFDGKIEMWSKTKEHERQGGHGLLRMGSVKSLGMGSVFRGITKRNLLSQAVDDTDANDWTMLHEWNDKSMNGWWMSQHSLSAREAGFSWGPALQKGSTLFARGGSCVTLWTLGGTLLAQIPSDKTYNVVWLAPECKLLVAAGSVIENSKQIVLTQIERAEIESYFISTDIC